MKQRDAEEGLERGCETSKQRSAGAEMCNLPTLRTTFLSLASDPRNWAGLFHISLRITVNVAWF
jgi:hypothetical protein